MLCSIEQYFFTKAEKVVESGLSTLVTTWTVIKSRIMNCCQNDGWHNSTSFAKKYIKVEIIMLKQNKQFTNTIFHVFSDIWHPDLLENVYVGHKNTRRIVRRWKIRGCDPRECGEGTTDQNVKKSPKRLHYNSYKETHLKHVYVCMCVPV